MAIYPKQLQHFDKRSFATTAGGPQIRDTSFGDVVILSDGATVIADCTVNTMIRSLEEAYYKNYTTTIDHVRSEPWFQPFDTTFGDVVVFPAGTISGDKSAGEIIDIMRVLWENDRRVSFNGIGYATSVQN